MMILNMFLLSIIMHCPHLYEMLGEKTRKYKIRMSTYNTSVKDDVIVLYRAKVNDISAVVFTRIGSKRLKRKLPQRYAFQKGISFIQRVL